MGFGSRQIGSSRTMLSSWVAAASATPASNSLVADPTGGEKVYIVQLSIFTEEAENVTLFDSAGGAISPQWKFGANSGIVLGSNAPGASPLFDSGTANKGIDVDVDTGGKDTVVTCVYYLE